MKRERRGSGRRVGFGTTLGLATLVSAIGFAAGCGARSALDEGDAETGFDASMPFDARPPPPDVGPPPFDAAPPDAFVPDAFVPDAFMPDAAPPDAGPPDAFVPDAFVPDAGPPDASMPDAGDGGGPSGESGCDGIDDDGDGLIDEGYRFRQVAPPTIISPTGDADRGNGDVWATATGFHATWWETEADGTTTLRQVALDPLGRPLGTPAPFTGIAGTAPGARARRRADGDFALGYCTAGAPTRGLARIRSDGTVLDPAVRTVGAVACEGHPPFAVPLAGSDGLLYVTDRVRLATGALNISFAGTPAPDARPFASMDATGGFVATPIVRGPTTCLAIERIAPDGRALGRVGCFESGDLAQPLANATAALLESGDTLFIIAIQDFPGFYALVLSPDGSVVSPLAYSAGAGDVNLEPELVAMDNNRLVYAASACLPLCNIKVFLLFANGVSWTGIAQDDDDEGFVAEPRLAYGGGTRIAMTYFARNPGGEDSPREIRSVVYDCVEVP